MNSTARSCLKGGGLGPEYAQSRIKNPSSMLAINCMSSHLQHYMQISKISKTRLWCHVALGKILYLATALTFQLKNLMLYYRKLVCVKLPRMTSTLCLKVIYLKYISSIYHISLKIKNMKVHISRSGNAKNQSQPKSSSRLLTS